MIAILVVVFGFTGQFGVQLMTLFVAGVCVHELHSMALPQRPWLQIPMQILVLGAIGFSMVLGFGIVVPLVIAMILFSTLVRGEEKSDRYLDFGMVYITLLLFVPMVYSMEFGLGWMLLGLAVIASGDIGAYFVGRAIGKRKLAEKISPKKTVEGAIGGMVAATGVANIIGYHFFPHMTWWQMTIFAILVDIAGILGDLFESALKRHYEVKDSGNILRGHGGFLDRTDSTLTAMPVVFMLAKLFEYLQ